MDCLFNYCGLVAGLVGLGFSSRFAEIESQLAMYYSPLNKDDFNELNFVYSIRVIMCQHCITSDTNVISHCAFLK